MSGNQFIPRIRQTDEDLAVRKHDSAGTAFQKTGQYAVVALMGLMPVFFVPGLWASLGFDKVMLTLVVAAVVLIAMSLLLLRRSQVLSVWPISLSLFWGVVLVALISGLLSGDSQDAIRGSLMEPQTVGFLAIFALAMTLPLVLQGSKNMTIKALSAFSLMATILLVYNVLRLLLGAEFLSLASFSTLTFSPIGGFNDLAIFAGLTIIFGLVTLFQLPLRGWIEYLIALLVFLSLIVLAVVNFFYIWIIIGFFGLVLFVYSLSRDSLFRSANKTTQKSLSVVTFITTLVVCLVSLLFIVAGRYAGGLISEVIHVNYVEVRPSVGATIDIARGVFEEDFLLGAGPNKFGDAWRHHKDISINETIFWDTEFSAGNGYVSTLFVSIGVLGGLLIFFSHLYFIYMGYKMFLRGTVQDSYWYYFGVVSFAAACFLWLMSYIYVPGAGILLLTALFTGLSFVAYGALVQSGVRSFPLTVNRQRGFFFMAIVILVVAASIGTVFTVGKQYLAEANFNQSQVTATNSEEFDQAAMSAFELYPDDRFVSARAQVKLSELNDLVGIQEPNAEQQKRFEVLSKDAITLAEQSVSDDPTNPDYYAVLAGVYVNLASAGWDGAGEKAEAALKQAQELDPFNPGYRLLAASMAVRIGDVTMAREEIAASLKLKSNYTQALFLSAQLDIAEGNTVSAIAITRSIITLEPSNPTRYFQLGILLSSDNQIEAAIDAFKTAISLDKNYANARYMLAINYIKQNQTEAAMEQLQIVKETNSDNPELQSLIKQLESGELIESKDLGAGTLVAEPDSQVITTDDVDTDLINSVNTIAEPSSKEEIKQKPAPVADTTTDTTDAGATSTDQGE